ncbi:MAG: translation repressor RelB [Eggerthellaceae bacterium]|nr:translation repressor RelB [Eggerthellaceae bacterium]
MAAVQMNTRIDKTLKEQGDASFAEFGYSPSEAVRLVWGFAARNRHNHRVMAEFIDTLDDSKEVAARAEKQARIDAILRGPALIQQFFEERGIDRSKHRGWTPEEMDEQIVDALIEDEERIRVEAANA